MAGGGAAGRTESTFARGITHIHQVRVRSASPGKLLPGGVSVFSVRRTRGGAEVLLLGQDRGGVTRPEVTRSRRAVSSSRRRARQADAGAREPPGSQGAADAARGATRSALAPRARAGAARAGGDSGRVPDVWATLAGALQVSETERDGEGTRKERIGYPSALRDAGHRAGDTASVVPN